MGEFTDSIRSLFKYLELRARQRLYRADASYEASRQRHGRDVDRASGDVVEVGPVDACPIDGDAHRLRVRDAADRDVVLPGLADTLDGPRRAVCEVNIVGVSGVSKIDGIEIAKIDGRHWVETI